MQNIMAIEWVQWVAAFGAFAFFLALIALAWWAWFSDRSRGRRRCPKCWHDLSHTPGPICGECGYHGAEELVFYRTRRKPVPALLAVVACALLCSFVIDRANVRGWGGFIPTTALLWIVPLADDNNGQILSELDRRMSGTQLEDETWLDIVELIVDGDAGARPPSPAWIQKYGRILNRFRVRLFNSGDDAQQLAVRNMMMGLPAGVRAESRLVWPEGVPPTVDIQVDDWWWPEQVQMRITATPDVPGAETDVHVRYRNRIQVRSYSLYLPELEPGDHVVPIHFTCERRLSGEDPWEVLNELDLTVPIHVEPATDEPVIAPVSDEEMDEAIRRCFSTGLSHHTSGSLPVRVGLDAGQTYTDLFNNIGIGVRIDVIRNGELARQLDIWWVGGSSVGDRQHSWEVPMWDDAVLGPPLAPEDEWVLRVRSMPKLALRLDEIDQYWEGDVTVPVTTFPARRSPGAAPSRGWMIEQHAQSQEAAAKGEARESEAPGANPPAEPKKENE